MKSEIINNIRVLSPAPGLWLCNRLAHVTSEQVWLGVNDTPDRWEEISAEEKDRLESAWAEEAANPDTDDSPGLSETDMQYILYGEEVSREDP